MANLISYVNKSSGIKIGDRVMIINNMCVFANYDTWIAKNAPDYVNFPHQHYYYPESCAKTIYEIVAKGKHLKDERMLYLVRGLNKLYVIQEIGLMKVKNYGKLNQFY